ncbi:MAG: DUF1559 domain-containing protein [Planctomycetaceae bacterium]|nr:DUF1559 domain-containing protein [Planctomycetaceae bacterium]
MQTDWTENQAHFGYRSGVTRTGCVVLLFIGLLLVILILPAIQQSREAARRSTCKNNLKSLGLAIHNYHDTYRGFPTGCRGPHGTPPETQWSYAPFLQPFLAKLHVVQADFTRPWDAPEQRPYKDGMGALWQWVEFKCPSDPRTFEIYGQPHTSYVGMLGVGSEAGFLPRDDPNAGFWAYEQQTTFDDITDGTTHTLCLLESMQNTGCWLSCGSPTLQELSVDKKPYVSGALDDQGQFGSAHTGGCQAVFADGSVRFIGSNIDPDVFRALCTISGEESKHEY